MIEKTLSSHQKIGLVKFQLSDIGAGKLHVLVCPYCGKNNHRPEDGKEADPLCCETLAWCVDAIFHDEEVAAAMEKARQIADRVVATQSLKGKIQLVN